MINFITNNSIKNPGIKIPEDICNYNENYVIKLKEQLSLYFGVNKDLIFLDNGSSAIIEKIISKNESFHLRENDFYLFKELAEQMNKKVILYKNENYLKDLEKVEVEKSSVVMFSLINNFDGEEINLDIIKYLAKKHVNVLFVVDGAYRELSSINEKQIKEILKHKNIIYLGTFSKAYGLAGLRVGYSLNDSYNKNLPFSISNLSAFMAHSMLYDTMNNKKSFLKSVLKITQKELKRFKNIGCKIKNHKVIYFNKDIDFVIKKLKEEKMLVKKINEYEISISLNDEINNKKLLNLLGKINENSN